VGLAAALVASGVAHLAAGDDDVVADVQLVDVAHDHPDLCVVDPDVYTDDDAQPDDYADHDSHSVADLWFAHVDPAVGFDHFADDVDHLSRRRLARVTVCLV
jgi:hypothetical protein